MEIKIERGTINSIKTTEWRVSTATLPKPQAEVIEALAKDVAGGIQHWDLPLHGDHPYTRVEIDGKILMVSAPRPRSVKLLCKAVKNLEHSLAQGGPAAREGKTL